MLLLLLMTACDLSGEDWSRDVAAFDLDPALLAWTPDDRAAILPLFSGAQRLDSAGGHAPGALRGDDRVAFHAVQFNTEAVASEILKDTDFYKAATLGGNEFERERAGASALAELRRRGGSVPVDSLLWTQSLDALGEYDPAISGFHIRLPEIGYNVGNDPGDGQSPEVLTMSRADAEALLPELAALEERGKALVQYRLDNWVLANGPAEAVSGVPGERTIRVYRALRVVRRSAQGCAFAGAPCAYDAASVALALATPGGRVLYARAASGAGKASGAEPRPDDIRTWPENWLVSLVQDDPGRREVDAVVQRCQDAAADGGTLTGWRVSHIVATGAVAYEADIEVTVAKADGATAIRALHISRQPGDDSTKAHMSASCWG